MKGAVDDLDLILQVLQRVGYSEDRFYIHVDGALFGLMMPFVKKVSFPECFRRYRFLKIFTCRSVV